MNLRAHGQDYLAGGIIEIHVELDGGDAVHRRLFGARHAIGEGGLLPALAREIHGDHVGIVEGNRGDFERAVERGVDVPGQIIAMIPGSGSRM